MSYSLGDNRERLKEASLILTGPFEGRPYSRSDFLEGIAAALKTSEPVSAHVLALGPLSRNQEWYITMTSVENKDLLLGLGTLTVKDKQFSIKSADNRKFTARVHWGPVYVTNAEIEAALSNYAEVTAISHIMSREKGFENVATGVRSVVMVGNRHQVPHLLSVTDPDTKETWQLLVTIPGRPPMCLKCRYTGHVRKDCVTPFCRHHGSFGHTTESCSAEKAEGGKRSYANVAKRKIVLDLEPRPRLAPQVDVDRQKTDPPNPLARPRSDDAPIDSVRPTETATRPRSPPPHGADRCASTDGVQPTATAPSPPPQAHAAGRCAPANRDVTRHPSPALPGAAQPTVVEKAGETAHVTTKDRTETGGDGRQTDRETDDVTAPPDSDRRDAVAREPGAADSVPEGGEAMATETVCVSSASSISSSFEGTTCSEEEFPIADEGAPPEHPRGKFWKSQIPTRVRKCGPRICGERKRQRSSTSANSSEPERQAKVVGSPEMFLKKPPLKK